MKEKKTIGKKNALKAPRDMIRIGPAGIPLSCKGRTYKDGIMYMKKQLDLNAIEIQLIHGMSNEEAEFIKHYAIESDIEVHVHAPYYMNLLGDKEELTRSFERIMNASNLAEILGAKTVIVHPGFYGDLPVKKAKEQVIKNTRKISTLLQREKMKVQIGLETMGKQKVFGSLEEIIEVCKEVKGVVPVIDVGHIHARGNGCLKQHTDFEEVFSQLKPLHLKQYLIHLTGVLYEDGNEYYHLPLKKGDMPLAPFIDVILDKRYSVTLISESPLLEWDAINIKLQVEKAIMKRTGKDHAYYKDLSEIYT